MARRRKKPTEVKTTKHADKRVNIPTQELSDFMTDEQRRPKPLLYPRNPALDPQLVWHGKDDQDAHPLEVLSKPIYVQEKLHPLAIVENVKAQAKNQKKAQAQQLGFDLFSDFNGIEWEDQIDFYSHQQNWTNRLILGDSLQIMASLADREGLKGQVQMIYLDPPYGIKFSSNWQISTRNRSVKDSAAGLSRQPEQVKAFRDTWELGIHSYLAYLRDRFVVARELLTETGSIFVQIGDENVHLVRCLLDEVFGSQNFVSIISFRKTGGEGSSFLGSICDFILWYAKDKTVTKYRQLYTEKVPGGDGAIEYTNIELPDGIIRKMTATEIAQPKSIPSGAKIFATWPIVSPGYSEENSVPIEVIHQGKKLKLVCPLNRHWSVGVEGTLKLWKFGRLLPKEGLRIFKRYISDFSYTPINNQWMDTRGAIGATYVVQTSPIVIQRCLLMTTDPGDLVLDPTCGSGTTAYVAEQWGRRWITCDTSRVALALARSRLMSVLYSYYKMLDPKRMDLKQGFVYKTAPHVLISDIANNPEIDDIQAKWQEKLEPIRGRLNTLLKQSWEEWEIPPEAEENWSLEAKKLLEQWWNLRRQRQAEIDDSIARNSEQETLYDQPEEESRVVRVAGPFTVESLSPFKPISPTAAAQQPSAVRQAKEADDSGKFQQQIIDNLREAGVQNTFKDERLIFDILDPVDGGLYIQAEGEYTGKDDQVRRVAVAVGPEHGTVDKIFLKAAATEAVKGLSADLLLVLGFAFEADITEETKQYGRLTVQIVRMNPDLTMSSLLKKTDKANLFMIFGEPDIRAVDEKGQEIGAAGHITPGPDDKIRLKILGLDIYDPTTGEIRSSSTKDIACWFIDTDYNGNAFFVRHAYFTGSGDPYKKLKRALRSDINEKAWKSLYKTTSLPFDKPDTGKIAVKVINHFGDEVLKVYKVK